MTDDIFAKGSPATSDDSAANAAGLSEDINELRNQLGRVITKLDHLAAGCTIMSKTLDAQGYTQPLTPQPTLTTVAAEAVAIAKSIEHYASLYVED